MVELKHVNFTYHTESEKCGTQKNGSLSDVNLLIERGETFLLTGSSGCGKTTILRLMNGRIPNYYPGAIDGNIFIDGESYEGEELYKFGVKVGTVFQNPRSQFFNVDTTGELAFGCENTGMD